MAYSDEDLLVILPRLVRADKAGRLYWLARPVEMFEGKDRARVAAAWNARFAGKQAFTTLHSDGYLRGGICGRDVLAHRVVWALIFGRWPVGDIDHQNHNRADNRPTNLREVTHQDYGRNCVRSIANTSGATGVYAFRGRWQASISVGQRKRLNLGTFDSFDAALSARREAERQYGFHPNHGAVAA